MLAKADVCTPLSVMVGLVRHEIAVGAVTLIAELPLLPSEVAVIVADPATSPVTSPLPFTLATAAALLAHVTTRPDSAFPLASFGVAASCTVPPTVKLADAGVTVTDATTAFTVMAADPVLPSLVAVTVAGPALTPVTRPVVDTVATVGVPEVHVTTRPVSTFPAASFVVAASCTVLLTATLADAGVTVTDATGVVTVMAADPVLPSLVAVTVAVPALTPVTSPVADTVTTVGVPEAHVTTRPVSTFPAASFVVAVNCTAPPTATAADAGATVTAATGAEGTTMVALKTPKVSAWPVTLSTARASTRWLSAGLVPRVHRSCAIPVTLVRAAPANTLPPPLVTRKFTSCPLCGSPVASTTFTTSGFGSSLPAGPDWRSPLTICTDRWARGCNGAAASFSQAYTSKPALSSNNALDRGCVRLLMLAMNPPWNEVEPVGTRTGRETLHIACCRVRDLGDAILSGGDT